MMKKVDIAIAGSGIACTATLIQLFTRLIDKSPALPKVSIAVFEKSNEFWYGIPYGSRSSVNALTITSVYDFFTDEKERDQFFAWFKQNKASLIGYYLANGGFTAQQWLKRNSDALNNEDYKNIYIPRFMFGRYTQNKFDALLKVAEEKGLIELTLIKAEVIDAAQKNDIYNVKYESAGGAVNILSATKMVIATGSAPVRDLVLPEETNGLTLINNLYEPRVDENIKKISAILKNSKTPEERNILLIGSNASSIEFLYLLSGMPEVLEQVNQLVVISRSGRFPYHIVKKTLESYPTINLDKVKANRKYNVETLVAAAMEDLKIAMKDGAIISYIDRIIGYTMELLEDLDEDAKEHFMGKYGMQLSNQFRRSGADYKEGEAMLAEIQKLTMLKGDFRTIEPTMFGGVLHYTDPDNQQKNTFSDTFNIVINCTGANDLDQSSSRLIYNLVHNQIAKVNLSGKGFLVNEKFEAAPNLYVMGPLLGGNKNNRIHFWHLENASRILHLAPFLADCLLDGLFEPQNEQDINLIKRYSIAS